MPTLSALELPSAPFESVDARADCLDALAEPGLPGLELSSLLGEELLLGEERPLPHIHGELVRQSIL